jgi:hypothetical protein
MIGYRVEEEKKRTALQLSTVGTNYYKESVKVVTAPLQVFPSFSEDFI